MKEGNFLNKIKETIRPILVSAVVLGATTAFGQNSPEFTDFKSKVTTETFKENTERQKQWLLNYLESPKFMERLGKELKATNKYKTEEEIRSKAEKIKEKREKNIKRTKIEFETLEEGLIGRTFISVSRINPDITILLDTIQDSTDPIPSTIVHEGTHGGTLHERDILKETQEKIEELIPEENLLNADSVLTVDDFGYMKDPSETHARINEIRYFMHELGMYDPNTEDFTEEHYKKLMDIFAKYPAFEKLAVKIMLNVIKEKDFIWMMNNIAGTDIKSEEDSTENVG